MAEMTRSPADARRGLGVAALILTSWAISVGWLIVTPIAALPIWAVPLLMVWMTFLYTGLFITAHDAMHGTVAPRYPALNDAVGAIAVGVYAAFRFKTLRAAHVLHHRHAGTPNQDPDFHDGRRTGLVAWYLTFLVKYVAWPQIAIMAIAFNVLQHLLGFSAVNLVLFWVVPSLLSTLQLFIVGTYLPHREGDGHDNAHHARSLDLPRWLSLLACYHFGYHLEHHARPGVPWWRLPQARAALSGGSRDVG
ncbi:MAG: fatty acid desaturase [Myxococcota bacterium]